MIVRGVDLAARYSAFVDLGSSGEVVSAGDSQGLRDVAAAVLTGMHDYLTVDYLVIEDLPQSHMAFTGIVKSVCRTQGRIIQSLPQGGLARTFLVPPALWQRHYPGVFRGGPEGAAAAASQLGYHPPFLLEERAETYRDLRGPERQKVRELLKKISTDYVDAFLIAQWAQDILKDHSLYEEPGLFRWDSDVQDFVSPKSLEHKPRKPKKKVSPKSTSVTLEVTSRG